MKPPPHSAYIQQNRLLQIALLVVLVLLAFVWNACGVIRSLPPPQSPQLPGSYRITEGFRTQTGVASHYGEKDQGNPTASGEPYNHRDFTGSHKSYPFGQYVMVTNLTNQQSVVVRINDRPNATDTKVIGLSGSAAAQIGLLQSGIARVEIVPVEPSASGINGPAIAYDPFSPYSAGFGDARRDSYQAPTNIAFTNGTGKTPAPTLSTAPVWQNPTPTQFPDYTYSSGDATTRFSPNSANPNTNKPLYNNTSTEKKSGLNAYSGNMGQVNALGGEDLPLGMSSMSPTGMIPRGGIPLKLKRNHYTIPDGNWTIQISAVRNQRSINDQQIALGPDLWQERTGTDDLIRLNFGRFRSKSEAQAVVIELKQLGYNDAYVKPAKNGF
ncbi:MAG TPA: septal ring lytic transglycosylase RlpA family protein [Rhodothermales bacterium]|nr:septal ring lytic transglycosylase RlpA family protein [Rhodothermales bacterium]